MMKRIISIIACTCIVFSLFSCGTEVEKKPFGAEVIEYDKVEGINKEGPLIETAHNENRPPMGNKTTFVESGPQKLENPNIKVEPTADFDYDADKGGIPIVVKESNNGS